MIERKKERKFSVEKVRSVQAYKIQEDDKRREISIWTTSQERAEAEKKIKSKTYILPKWKEDPVKFCAKLCKRTILPLPFVNGLFCSVSAHLLSVVKSHTHSRLTFLFL